MVTKTLILAKGGFHFIFRYSHGCEEQVLDHLMRMAKDEDLDFDWLDAATVSLQVAEDAPVLPSGHYGRPTGRRHRQSPHRSR
jgi:hypothetical protein